MRIETPKNSPYVEKRVKEELDKCINGINNSKHTRICDGCTVACSCSQSLSCTCDCSLNCPNASAFLSSDPQYPIESKITPLVYALKTTQSFIPCWSCEGHIDHTGTISRLPRVWFYCEEQFNPRILTEYLEYLSCSKKITYPWQLSVISPTVNHYHLTFSLEPNLSLEEKAELSALQQDNYVIAENMDSFIKPAIHNYLRQLGQL